MQFTDNQIGTEDPLLRDKQVAILLGVSVPTIWRRVADGTIPKPLKIGALSRWLKSDIHAVIVQAMAKRSAVGGAA